MKDYPTLLLDTNSSTGTALLLLFCISVTVWSSAKPAISEIYYWQWHSTYHIFKEFHCQNIMLQLLCLLRFSDSLHVLHFFCIMLTPPFLHIRHKRHLISYKVDGLN